jgi:hypothetical protein
MSDALVTILSCVAMAGSCVAPFVVDPMQRWGSRRRVEPVLLGLGQRLGFRLVPATGIVGSHVRYPQKPVFERWAVLDDDATRTGVLPGASMFRSPATPKASLPGLNEGLLLQYLLMPKPHLAVTCYFGGRISLVDPMTLVPTGVFLMCARIPDFPLLVSGDATFDARFLISVAGDPRVGAPLKGVLPLPSEFRGAALALVSHLDLTLLYDGVSAVVTVGQLPSDESFRGILRLLETFEAFVPELLALRDRQVWRGGPAMAGSAP